MSGPQFGHPSRWMINKSSDGVGWLLHEPIEGYGTSSATWCPSFWDAVELFTAYTAAARDGHR